MENNYTITTAEILENIEEGFGLSDYWNVWNELQTMESPTNFTGGRAKTLQGGYGLISLKEFFSRLDDYGYFITVDELKEIFKNYSEEWVEEISDNSYNYGGRLERDINYASFEDTDGDNYIVFIAVHVGLDIRGGYTEYFPMRFESRSDFEEACLSTFEVAYIEYLDEDGDENFISVDGEAFGDLTRAYFHSTYSDYDEFIDLDTPEETFESLMSAMDELDIPYQKDSFKVVE